MRRTASEPIFRGSNLGGATHCFPAKAGAQTELPPSRENKAAGAAFTF